MDDNKETLDILDEEELMRECEPFMADPLTSSPHTRAEEIEDSRSPASSVSNTMADLGAPQKLSASRFPLTEQREACWIHTGCFDFVAVGPSTQDVFSPEEAPADPGVVGHLGSFSTATQEGPAPRKMASETAVSDYRNGLVHPDEYLRILREEVDPDFLDEDWGDRYYFADQHFADQHRFKFIEDCETTANEPTTDPAITKGLELYADRIPLHMTRETCMSGSPRSPVTTGYGVDGPKHAASSTSYQRKQQLIQAKLHDVETTRSYLPRDLDPRIAAQELFRRGFKTMLGSNVGGKVDPSSGRADEAFWV